MIVLCLITLCRYWGFLFVCFYKLKVVATHWQQVCPCHLLILYFSVTFWSLSQHFTSSTSKKSVTHWRLKWLTFFSNNVVLAKVWHYFYRQNIIAYLIDYCTVYPQLLYARGSQKNSCDLLYCNICFIVVVLEQTHGTSNLWILLSNGFSKCSHRKRGGDWNLFFEEKWHLHSINVPLGLSDAPQFH